MRSQTKEALRHADIGSVQSLNRIRLFATPWTAARQASLSITNSQSLLRLTSIKSMMPSNHLILCHPLLLRLTQMTCHYLLIPALFMLLLPLLFLRKTGHSDVLKDITNMCPKKAVTKQNSFC